MKSQLRLFAAIEIASQVRTKIARYLNRHVTDLKRVKWVSPDQFHLTLKFLGNVPQTEIHHVIQAIKNACDRNEPFDLVFEEIGAFPNVEHPRTLWVGVSEGIEESTDLAEAIDEELAEIGYPREPRRFAPHLTIGRVKKSDHEDETGLDAFLLPAKGPSFFGISSVTSVTLFSSELSRGGPKYEPLAEIDLKSVE